MNHQRILRHSSDRRSVFYALVLFPMPLVVGIFSVQLGFWLAPLVIYLSFCSGVLAHYHNHLGVFVNKRLNRLYSVWLSMFYGFPLFAWIPTHNQNHHRFINGPADRTSTMRRGGRDNLLELLIYPTLSSVWQAGTIAGYLASVRDGRRNEWRWALAQAFATVLYQLAAALLLVEAHGLSEGALLYGALVGIPALLGPWMMMAINYLQHVGCVHNSPDNHSRNFCGRWENWLVFEAGLHTVHHEHPGTHWSQYPRLHAAREADIAPHLNQRNVPLFLLARYVLPPLARLLPGAAARRLATKSF